MRGHRRSGQRGQTLPIFALASLFIIGTVALTVDFGFLANQHRNLQVFADQASTAGAYKLGSNPGPNDRTAARKAAFLYLRDNLGLGGAIPALSLATVMASCGDFTSNVGTAGTASCQLGSTTFKVSIWSPAEGIPAGQDLGLTRTVSVRISEGVTTALAGIFSASQVNAGAFSVAQYGPGQPSFALYSDGCVNITSNKLESIAGNMYINECSLNPQGNGAFCTYTEGPSASPRLGASSGAAVYGPYANLPTTILSSQTVAGCTVPASPAGTEFATGNVIKAPEEESPPAYSPPPNIPATLLAASATNSCRAHIGVLGNAVQGNGTKDALGNDPHNCYDPGEYTTIGLASPIANNLNPGVYHILGDNTTGCYTSSSDLDCTAVLFGDNTLNANYNDVLHKCWANPQIPAAGTFSAPCPDGFIDDPTTGITDPQCAPGCPATALTKPTFTLTASALGGFLDPIGTGTTYYVRVTAKNGFGESISNEVSVNVVSPLHTGSITVQLTGASVGATGYNIYGPSIAPATELLSGATFNAAVPPSATLTSIPVNTALFPLFDSSACPGFCNIPLRPTENYGVTFVLEGKASVCLGELNGDGIHCDDTNTHPLVLLSPYCASGFTAAGSGTSATQLCNSTSASSNDGAFVFYGPTQGTVLLGGQGTGVTMGITGVLDLPRAYLNIDEGRFHAVPGQVIVHNVDIDSVNLLDPLVYFGLGPPPPISVRLIQ